MIIEVLSICRRPPAWVTDAADEYAKRLAGDVTLKFKHLAPGRDTTSAEERRKDEAKRLSKALKSDTHVIALDIQGDEYTSETLAKRLEVWRADFGQVALVIGGPDGLESEFLTHAASLWSLSKLTLPHLLVQIIVAEQIYRAWTILERHPYHRAGVTGRLQSKR